MFVYAEENICPQDGTGRQIAAERWRRLRNDELYNLFCSRHVMRIMKVTDDDMGTGHSTIIGDMKIHRKFNPRPSHNPDTNHHKKT